jgi:hypothetical protein
LATALSRPLRPVVGDYRARLLGRPERAHLHEPRDAGVARGVEERSRAADHHPLEVVGSALDDRDQVDDVGAALGRRSEGAGVGQVARHELDPERRERRSAIGAPGEHADLDLSGAESVDDRRPHEPRSTGDEDLHRSKFCQ